MPDLEQNIVDVLNLIDRTIAPAGCRKTIGVAGPPGSGKSTLAEALVDRINGQEDGAAALVPMDGFHMDNAQLDQLGLRAVKGAPHTFDAEAFIAALRTVRPAGSDGVIPLFDRSQDRTVPGARAVAADTRILVVEGNYLLLTSPPWQDVAALLDATVALRPPLDVLERRLIQRWRAQGLSMQAAQEKTRANDLKNARHVIENSAVATMTLHHPK